MTTEVTRTAAPPVDDPYIGLTYFTEEYVEFFFGRDEESGLIIGNLRASRLTLLYAESGVGKSSVLRAGVVARLHEVADRDLQGGGHPRLVPVVFSSWSERPLALLVEAIAEAIRPYLGGAAMPELPEDDLEAALEAAGQSLDATLLVILDQFEEHLLYRDAEPQPDRVAAQIARCVNRPDLRANFLISIREDSYAELGDLFRGKIKNVYGNFLHLDFLDRAGGRNAIERPIARVNELQPEAEPFSVEPALVEAVLSQIRHGEEDDRIETTYLQLVMRRLWQEERAAGSHTLRAETLERLGGAQEIIAGHLDRAMEGGDGLASEQRLVAARIFRFLVTGGGTKIALSAADLADLTDLPRAEIEPVVRHLSSPRLHILRRVAFREETAEPRFEIFHDALAEPIRKWRRRVEEQERSARRRRERAEKEEAQRAAAEAEHQAEEERKRKRVAQLLLAVAMAALVAGAVYFGIDQAKRADDREAATESVRTSERISELAWVPSFGPTPAALASLETYEVSPTDEARERALAQLQLNPGLPTIAAGHTRGVESVAFMPGSELLASGGDDTVRRWNRHGEEVGNALVADSDVLAVAASKPTGDGTRFLAAGLQTGGVALWKVPPGGRPEGPREIPGSPRMSGVAFSPAEPELLAVGGRGGEVALWDLGERGGPADTTAARGDVEDLAFAPDGGSLYVASTEAAAAVDVTGAGLGAATPIGDEPASAAAAGPGGAHAFGGRGGVELWPAGGGKPQHLGLPGKVEGLAFAEGGSVLVAGGTDGSVTTWDLASLRPFGPPRTANRAAVNDVAVSAAGEIAAGGGDHLVKVWPLQQGRRLAITLGALSPEEAGGKVPKIFDFASGGKNREAVAAGSAGTLVWPLPGWGETDRVPEPIHIPGRSFAAASHKFTPAEGEESFILVTGQESSFVVYDTDGDCDSDSGYCRLDAPAAPRSAGAVRNLVFAHHDGRLLLASSGRKGERGVVNLWDLTGVNRGGQVRHLSSVETDAHISGLAFGRAKPIVAAATKSGDLVLWDVSETGRPREIFRRNPERQPLYALAFSADGSLLASGGRGQQVVLWQLGEGADEPVLTRLPGTLLQRQSIDSLSFSPGGGTLAAADAEGNICLYRVDNRHLIGDRSCLRGYNISALRNGGIEAVKFGSMGDGSVALFSGGRGQPLVAWNSLLWNLSDSTAVEEAISNYVCALAGRNMEKGEWEAVFTSTDLAEHPDETCPGNGR